MSRRIVIEEPCEHGNGGTCLAMVGTMKPACPGGSRTVLDPEEWIERAARELAAQGGFVVVNDAALKAHIPAARAVLESVLGDGQ